MRLLNKRSLAIEWFSGPETPPYLILSHRWRGEETSLQAFLQEKQLSDEEWSPGTAKVVRLCREAMHHDAEYVWIDTCCIDKTSSAELQEAINSMYSWYEGADLCLAYLDDVSLAAPPPSTDCIKAELAQSRWFTRGWTLQEMLAPKRLRFVDRDWSPIGDRNELSDILESITGIRQSCYGDQIKIRSTPAAERMSWLSRRETTRGEDVAYCMLGIFNVNMTMLYGEGTKAFLRLQKEIIQEIDDESILAWVPPTTVDLMENTALAPSPACFSVFGQLEICKDVYFEREPYRMTTKGLEIELFESRIAQFGDELSVILNCTVDKERVCIPIARVSKSFTGPNQWRRVKTDEVSTVTLGRYHSPRSAWEEFGEQAREMGGVNQSAMNQGLAQMRFEHDPIRFKIFIK